MAVTLLRKKVAVVGAGIVGVNVALEIQRRYSDFDLTIIAEKFNGETLSDGAAGLFRPDTYIFGPNLEVSRKWIIDSYEFYKKLLDNSDESSCGINEVSGYLFSSKDRKYTKNHYLECCLPNYRDATNEELVAHSSDNKTAKYGSYFTSMVIECKSFLPWALKKIVNNGGTCIIKQKLESFDELYGKYDVIFNCSGLEAGKLCQDLDVLPIRGQVIRVNAPWVDKFYYMDSDTYIIPSKEDGTIVLGGCRHFGSYDEQVNKRNTDEILERCIDLLPSLKELLKTDYKIWVGLRPYRNKIRVESEIINNTIVIHNYGHGGYGVTLAPGTAKYAVDLLNPYL